MPSFIQWVVTIYYYRSYAKKKKEPTRHIQFKSLESNSWWRATHDPSTSELRQRSVLFARTLFASALIRVRREHARHLRPGGFSRTGIGGVRDVAGWGCWWWWWGTSARVLAGRGSRSLVGIVVTWHGHDPRGTTKTNRGRSSAEKVHATRLAVSKSVRDPRENYWPPLITLLRKNYATLIRCLLVHRRWSTDCCFTFTYYLQIVIAPLVFATLRPSSSV